MHGSSSQARISANATQLRKQVAIRVLEARVGDGVESQDASVTTGLLATARLKEEVVGKAVKRESDVTIGSEHGCSTISLAYCRAFHVFRGFAQHN
jgi:hypothetical protein